MNNNAVNVPCHIWKCGDDLLHKVFLRIRLHAAFFAVFLIGIKQLCRTGTISGVQLAVILVLFLYGQIIFANKRLENDVVIYVLGRQVASLPKSSAVLKRSFKACQDTLDTFCFPKSASFSTRSSSLVLRHETA